jgi:F-type H+-transporting ATPase subunit alpha
MFCVEERDKLGFKFFNVIYCGTNGLLMDVPVNKIKEFETEFISFLHAKHQDTLDDLAAGKLTDEIKSTLEKVAADLSQKYDN